VGAAPTARFAYNANPQFGRATMMRTLCLVLTLTIGVAATSVFADKSRETSLRDVVQLTKGLDRAGEAYFSPDMGWIIFQGTPKGEQHYAMYVAKLENNGEAIVGADKPIRISPLSSRNTCGFFAPPGGESLIFASTSGKEKGDDGTTAGYQRQGGTYKWDFPDGMEIFRADGWRELVATPKDGKRVEAVNLAKTAITHNNAYDAEGSYSPDGKWIVFSSRRDGDSELYVMKPDGSGAVRLTNVKGYDGGPFFAPDGKRILYRSDRKGNDLLQIFVSNLKFDEKHDITGIADERQLTDDANVNWGPYFHRDDKHIVYATSAHGHANYELYVMRDDGSHKIRITYREGFDGLPVFSPDGKYLMWSSKRSPDNTTQIFIAKFVAPEDW
jgi:dipeptidyl aminopeptidase/acylaminoacyl peptidase